MPIPIIMPDLGTVSDTIKLFEWLVKEGDEVAAGQPIFRVESDKAIMEVEATSAGWIQKILAQAGMRVKPGEAVATLVNPGENLASGETITEQKPATALSPKVQPTQESSRKTFPDKAFKPEITPKALQFARENKIDLENIKGSGPQGRITFQDVENASLKRIEPVSPEKTGTDQNDEFSGLKGLRATIARNVANSTHSTARVTTVSEVPAERLIEIREKNKADLKPLNLEVPYDLLLAKICSSALREFPYMNSSLTAQGIHQHPAINIGIAVDTTEGLLVPVLADVDKRSLTELAKDLQEKVERAKNGAATPKDLSGGTFTITNVGMYAIDAFTPIIHLPECAILGMGRIRETAVIENGQVRAGHLITLSLSYDHRLVDGVPAARFMTRICELVKNPDHLFQTFENPH